jgi:hypothetical protein
MGMETKVCQNCGATKPINDFHRDKARKDGRAIRCKACALERLATYNKRPPRNPTPPGTKRCTICKAIKPESAFSHNRIYHDGLDRTCKPCRNAASHAYDQKNKTTLNTKQLERYHRNPQKYADRDLRKRFGLPLGSYDQMLAAQDGKCAICGKPPPNGRTRRLHVDHCHDTGKVRALLCMSCNNGLGRFNHDPAIMRIASSYVEQYSLPEGSSI